MPTYEYLCKPCNAIDEVERTMEEATKPYFCADCHKVMERHYTPPQVITEGPQDRYMHPAFGRVMNDREARIEAKRRGWIEIGNEKPAEHIDPPERKSYEANDYFL
jgi:hypothetical protein